MKSYRVILLTLSMICTFAMGAQTRSQSTQVRRGPAKSSAASKSTEVSARLKTRMETPVTDDSQIAWMKVIYRSLDLTKDSNAALYYPEEPIEGEESFFRLIMRLVSEGQIPAYEYLDGRELFTDEHKVNLNDMYDRFHIDPSDVPANEVLSFYVVERWEFDNRNTRMNTRIQAVCPVLHRSDDFGYGMVKYPMFWVKYDDLRPYLTDRMIFVDDDNNMPTCTFDDFFTLGRYSGEIYKTRNMQNKSMAQLYSDPDALKHAQDSIERRLQSFESGLWVPSLEELESKGKVENQDSKETVGPKVSEEKKKASATRRGSTKSVRKPKKETKSNATKSAVRSVRSRKS